MAQETQPGRVVAGRFRLDEVLARGGYGIVWKARDQMLGLDVAVKEVYLPPATSPKEHARRLVRAEREARNAAALRDHPHIVAVHDMVTEDDKPWMVMRLVAGHSLEQHLADEGPLPEATAIDAARCLLDALRAAHTAGIVHRDVKPANVMVADDGSFLLTDFGIAVHSTDTSLTTTGDLVGSLEYVAPERAHGGDDEPAGDLFSLGATLYQAVEDVSPFRRDNPTATIVALLTEPPPRPRRAGRLELLITALLEKDPARRPTVAQALLMLDDPSTWTSEQVRGDDASSASQPPPEATPPANGSSAQKATPGATPAAGGSKASTAGTRSKGTSSTPKQPTARATVATRKPAGAAQGSGNNGNGSNSNSNSNSNGSAAAALLVIVAAVAVFLAVHETKKDDANASGSSTTVGTATYDPYIPRSTEPDPITTTEDTPTTPANAGCSEAIDAMQNQFDLMPSPMTTADRPTVAVRFRDMASDLDSAADEATDGSVESAIRALAADARALSDSETAPGFSGYDTASDAMTDDLDELKTTCAAAATAA
ncbi:protein kinase [Streptomyces sp. NPDC005209]|uniref:serine/threonine-protein kinase n=1 Tax=Streptomyces sp. NPDC005209 TaxID=3156715 RepID=UPI0033AA2F7C